MRKLITLAVAACLILFLTLPAGAQQTTKRAGKAQPRVQQDELIRLLAEPIDTKDFTTPMTLKDALGLLYEKFAAKGKELPFLADRAAFHEDVNDKGEKIQDIYDTQVHLAPLPRTVSVATALRVFLSASPMKPAFLVRDAQVWIVPEQHATADFILKQKVLAQYRDQPLEEVFRELSGRAGISIVVDPRARQRVTQEVSVVFRNDVTLRDALTMLARMADLQADFLPSGVFITQVANGV